MSFTTHDLIHLLQFGLGPLLVVLGVWYGRRRRAKSAEHSEVLRRRTE